MASRNQLFGKATITVGGQPLDSLPGASIDPGFDEKTPVEGDGRTLGRVHKSTTPMIECEVALRAGMKLSDLDFVDETVAFLCDSGQRFVLVDAWSVGPLKATGGSDGGKVALKIAGMRCIEQEAA